MGDLLRVQAGPDSLKTSIRMEPHTEGWMGIPHGGISMAAFTELAGMLYGSSGREIAYPFTADFRLGGASARVGDVIHLEVALSGAGVQGSIRVNEQSVPYLKAELRPARSSDAAGSVPFRSEPTELTPLPYYKNCFVCGCDRSQAGLRRKFYLFETDAQVKTVIAKAGFDPVDFDSFYLFQKGGNVHPLAFMGLLDETIGWGGFMLTSTGAVTVRIGYTFHRPVAVGEKLIFYGQGDRVRGRAESRLLSWASGGAAVVRDDGELEQVAAASGQWMAVPELTEQMRTNLIPKESVQAAFDLADNPLGGK